MQTHMYTDTQTHLHIHKFSSRMWEACANATSHPPDAHLARDASRSVLQAVASTAAWNFRRWITVMPMASRS